MESNFQIDNQLAATITHPELKKNILLIAKEAINNTAKYSEASKVIISLQNINEAIVLSVTDNGRGFNTQKIIEGNGLKNMKQRTEQLGGRF
jgi:signal transduction histidine kinase